MAREDRFSPSLTIKQALAWLVFMTTASVLVAQYWRDVWDWRLLLASYSPELCNCYGSGDCASDEVCLGGSLANAMLCLPARHPGQSFRGPWPKDMGSERDARADGLCWGPEFWTNPLLEHVPFPPLAVDTYLSIYADLGLHTGGRPREDQIEMVNQKLAQAGLSAAQKDLIRIMTNHVLEALLGFDFVPDRTTPGLGYIPKLTPAGSRAIALTREAIRRAIDANDSSAIEKSIAQFWSEHPGYRPMHTGRCFPHGHEHVTGDADAAACQVFEIRRALTTLLRVS